MEFKKTTNNSIEVELTYNKLCIFKVYSYVHFHTHTHTHIYITCSIKDHYNQDSEYSHYPKYFLLPLCNPSLSLILYQPRDLFFVTID